MKLLNDITLAYYCQLLSQLGYPYGEPKSRLKRLAKGKLSDLINDEKFDIVDNACNGQISRIIIADKKVLTDCHLRPSESESDGFGNGSSGQWSML